MRLYEFVDDNPLRVKLVALTDQLKDRFMELDPDEPVKVDDFLEYLRRHDIVIDKGDFYDIVKEEPLRNMIRNVKGQDIYFKGQTINDQPVGAPEASKIIKSMASKQAKKSNPLK